MVIQQPGPKGTDLHIQIRADAVGIGLKPFRHPAVPAIGNDRLMALGGEFLRQAADDFSGAADAADGIDH